MKTEFSTIFSALFTAAWICLCQTTTGQDFDDTSYEQVRDIEIDISEDTVGALRFDDEIYRNNNRNFTGLRIVGTDSGGGQTVPYLIEKVHPPLEKSPRSLEKELLSLQETEDNQIVVTSRIESGNGPVNRIEIQTTLTNFERRVTIEGSTDGNSWEPLAENQLIFDYSRFIDFRKTTIEFPENNFTFYRITVSSAVDQLTEPLRRITRTSRNDGMTEKELVYEMLKRPFRIDTLSFRFQPAKEPKMEKAPELRAYETASLSVQVDEESKSTIVSFDSFHQPVTRITVQTPERNFRRDVLVQVPSTEAKDGEESSWKTVHRGAIFHFDIGELKEERLTLEFPEQRESGYRLVIENGDNPPLPVSGATTTGPVYQLLFLARPEWEYQLYYGRVEEAEKAPNYDTSVILAAKRKGIEPTVFETGKARNNPGFSHAVPQKSFADFLENKGMLWGIIALVVVVLIGVLFRTARRIENLEDS